MLNDHIQVARIKGRDNTTHSLKRSTSISIGGSKNSVSSDLNDASVSSSVRSEARQQQNIPPLSRVRSISYSESSHNQLLKTESKDSIDSKPPLFKNNSAKLDKNTSKPTKSAEITQDKIELNKLKVIDIINSIYKDINNEAEISAESDIFIILNDLRYTLKYM